MRNFRKNTVLLFVMILVILQPLCASEDSSYLLVTTGLRDKFNEAFPNVDMLKALCHKIYTQREEEVRLPSKWFYTHFPVIIAEVCLDNYAAAAASTSAEEDDLFEQSYDVLNNFIVSYEKLLEGVPFIQSISDALNRIASEKAHIELVQLLPCLPQKKTAYKKLLEYLGTNADRVFVPREGLWDDVIATGDVCAFDHKIIAFLYTVCKTITKHETLDLKNAVLTNRQVLWFVERVNALALNEAYPISTRLLCSAENLKRCLSITARIPVENYPLIEELIMQLFLRENCIITDRSSAVILRDRRIFGGYFKNRLLSY